MKPILSLLLLWPFIGCQPLQLPPRSDFQTIALGESGMPNLYFFIRDFHNSKFNNDPFEKILKSAVERRQTPAPQQSEAAIERWTVESISHKLYDYSILVGITREAGLETILTYKVIAIDDHLLP